MNAVSLHGSGVEMENTFFDGDFAFRVRRLDRLPLADAEVRLTFLRSGRRVSRAPAPVMSLRDYSIALCRAALPLIRGANRRKLSGAADMTALVAAVAALKDVADIRPTDLRAPSAKGRIG
jgi:hypothetical protein